MSQIRRPATSPHLVDVWYGEGVTRCEVACAPNEVAVMCAEWTIQTTLGPGLHTWHNPNSAAPVAVYFVRIDELLVGFEVTCDVRLPTRDRVSWTAKGEAMVACPNAEVLVAQFVGLPLVDVGAGIARSVVASAERLTARTMARFIFGAEDPRGDVFSDMSLFISEVERLGVTAGAVFGLDLVQIRSLDVFPTPVSREMASARTAEIRALQPTVSTHGFSAGQPVMVAWTDGRMISATIIELVESYAEVEIGGSSERAWVLRSQLIST